MYREVKRDGLAWPPLQVFLFYFVCNGCWYHLSPRNWLIFMSSYINYGGKRWCSWFRHRATSRKVAASIGIFHWQPFRQHYGPEIDSASNRNEYHQYFPLGKGGRYVGLTTLPPSCAACHEIWEPQPPGILRACPVLYRVVLPFIQSICTFWKEFISSHKQIFE